MDRSSFDAHAVWSAVTELETLLRQAEERGDVAASPHVSAVRYLVASLRAHAEPIDAGPYTATGLNAVNSGLAQVVQEVRNFVSNGNLQHLVSAANSCDTTMHTAAMWPASVLKGGAAAQAYRVFAQYRESAESSMQVLRDANTELEQQIEAERAKSHAEMSALTASIEQLDVKISRDEARLDTALTTNNETFTTAQTQRQKEFADWLAEQEEAVTSNAAPDLSRLVAMRDEGSEHLASLEKLHTDVEKVSGKAAAAILARDYGSYAMREWVSGVIAYVLGFGLLVAIGGYLVHTVNGVARDDAVSWQYVALKLGLTLTAAAASGVAFQFGHQALSRSSTNKRVQLELATIGTFLADVDDEEAVKRAKLSFVDRTFGRAWDGSGVPSSLDEAT